MGTYKPNGGRNAPDENRPTWRPQDQPHPGDYRGRGIDFRDHDIIRDERWRDRDSPDDDADRDPRRWEGSRGSELGYHEDRPLARSTERYGQGQSGYSAGRYGDDRSQQMRNRSDLGPSGYDRDRDLGGDDRFSGRGGPRNEPWRDEGRGDRGMRGGVDQGTGYDQRMGYERDFDPRGTEQRMDYSRGNLGHTPYGQTYGGSGREEPNRSYGVRGSQDAQGYRGSQTSSHTHSGTGPHRGKGPAGYQRSDERIRELVCDALADDDMIDASQIHVTVKDGEVTLAGVVDDRRTKREAEDCVASVPGVRDVQIQLRVKDERAPSTRSQPPGNGATAAKPEIDDKKHRA